MTQPTIVGHVKVYAITEPPEPGFVVAVDGWGWIDGSWPTFDEALQAGQTWDITHSWLTGKEKIL
jgi:hypothetical protein